MPKNTISTPDQTPALKIPAMASQPDRVVISARSTPLIIRCLFIVSERFKVEKKANWLVMPVRRYKISYWWLMGDNVSRWLVF